MASLFGTQRKVFVHRHLGDGGCLGFLNRKMPHHRAVQDPRPIGVTYCSDTEKRFL